MFTFLAMQYQLAFGEAGVSRVPFGKGFVEKGTRTWSLKGKRDVDTRKAESALFIFPRYLLR